jgi:hypothetical protein
VAIIDADWWTVRRKFSGSAGASQAMSGGPLPVYRNRHPYLRRKPCSCNPTTPRQLAARARWAYITKAWQDVLTADEREVWTYEIEEYIGSWLDEEQQAHHITGYEYFCGVNARVLAAGLPLCTSLDDWYPAGTLSLLELELLTPTRIRATFDLGSNVHWSLALYGRGPLSVGCNPVVPPIDWWRDSVPSRWYLIGYGPQGAPSPVEMDLPHAIRPGLKLAAIGGMLSQSGEIPDDWLLEQVTATP